MASSRQDMSSVLVSVLIPSYNVEDYIERCVTSVMHQTYAPLECVIIDDGSTDHTAERINNILKDYQGEVLFSFLQQRTNQGVSSTRNHLLESAHGDYVFFLDSDDEITSDCVSQMMSLVEEHPDIEIVQGLIKSIPDNPIYHWERYKDITYMDDNNWVRLDFFKSEDYFPCQVANKLISTSFIKSYGLYFKPGIIHEDHSWMIHAARKLRRFAFVHAHTYVRHYRESSIMMTTNNYSQQSNDSWAFILTDALDTIDSPFPIHQLNKLTTEFLYRYHFSGKKYQDVEKALSHALMKEGLYIGAVLLFLFSHVFKKKGNWRCQTLLIKYLTKKAEKEKKSYINII